MKIQNRGITLVELLVVLSIFLLISAGATRIFVTNLRSQRIILAEQLLLDQANYIVEYMSRALRMAKKELNCTDPADFTTCKPFYPENPSYCLTKAGYGYNYEIIGEGEGIRFINPMRRYEGKYACQEFYLEDGILKEEIIKPFPLEPTPLLSDRIRVNSEKFGFTVSGNSQYDDLQPKVTINMEFEIPEENLKINVQNTISQRDLDVEY